MDFRSMVIGFKGSERVLWGVTLSSKGLHAVEVLPLTLSPHAQNIIGGPSSSYPVLIKVARRFRNAIPRSSRIVLRSTLNQS